MHAGRLGLLRGLPGFLRDLPSASRLGTIPRAGLDSPGLLHTPYQPHDSCRNRRPAGSGDSGALAARRIPAPPRHRPVDAASLALRLRHRSHRLFSAVPSVCGSDGVMNTPEQTDPTQAPPAKPGMKRRWMLAVLALTFLFVLMPFLFW